MGPRVSVVMGCVLLVAVGLLAEQAGPGAVMNLPGKVDANYALLVSAPSAVDTTTQVGPQSIANLPGKVDANSALLVAFQGGTLALSGTAFGDLPASDDGTMLYCSDCAVASAPCTGASTGAFAFRVNGGWRCQ